MEKKSFIKKLFSVFADDAEIKRFAFFILLILHVVSYFLLMYIKIEIANKDLVSNAQDWNAWLIIACGGLVGLEPVLNKMKLGGIKTVVSQDVEKQTVNNNATTVITEDPKPPDGYAQ